MIGTILSVAVAVVVALIDTGIDASHPHFANTRLEVVDVTGTSPEGEDCGELGHGTGVAGVLVDHAPRASVLMVKVQDCEGGRLYMTEGIRRAADMGADIISIQYRHLTTNTLGLEAINYALGKGIKVIAAAGNDGWDRPVYPAAYPGVIAVGCDREEWGGTNYGEWVDEIGICQARIAVAHPNLYGYSAGTSFAAPMIAGRIARQLMGDSITYLPHIVSGVNPRP